jgi:hypothetical protein
MNDQASIAMGVVCERARKWRAEATRDEGKQLAVGKIATHRATHRTQVRTQ